MTFDSIPTLNANLVGTIVVVALALALVPLFFVRRRPAATRRLDGALQPALHLRTHHDDVYVVPATIHFPAEGKLRIGYHPPFMDRHVGRTEFGRLAFVDVRGDAPAARELSRHAACIWRDANGGCYVQIGWPGPGEPIRPRNQTRVLRFGRPHDAASQPFRLAHRDVLRLSTNVEYVFLEVEAVQDRPTPEQKKIEAFESSTVAPSSNAKLSLLRPERRRDDGDDLA
jgi:hypothetical protein